ncbi:hypothetical protein DUNSADRAFT_18294, partial [Dunaliella salina]
PFSPSPVSPPPSPFPPPVSPPPPSVEPVDDLDVGGNTFFFVGLPSFVPRRALKQAGQELTFQEADTACRERRGSLVTVESQTEQADTVQVLIQRFFSANDDYPGLQFWAGYRGINGNYVSFDGSQESVEYVRDVGNLPESFDSPVCVIGESVEQGDQLSYFTIAGCEERHPGLCKVSPCSECDTCVERWYKEYTSLNTGEIDFEDLCVELGYPASVCSEASFTIASSLSKNGTTFLEERPAAICNLLGDCNPSDDCLIRDPGETLSKDGSSYWIPEEIDYW